METLTPPKIETQPSHDIEAHVDGIAIAYHQHAGARRTEHTGNATAVIDSKEPDTEDSLGSFEMGDVSLPVVAKFSVENKPDSYAKDASPESEFLVVDIRGLGLNHTLGSSVSGFKASVDVAQRLGKSNHADDAPQYALVNLTSIQRRSREGGSLFSISTISRDPENPTMIRRDHTLHGEATVDNLSFLGLGESNVAVTSDENGKIIISMAQESNEPMQLDTIAEPLGQYQPQYGMSERNRAKTERLYWGKKLLGESAMHSLFAADTFAHYRKAAYDLRNNDDFWTRTASDSTHANTYNTNDIHTDTAMNMKPAEAMNKSSLQTPDDVRNRIADLRQANVADKDIKRTLLRDLHPDFNPDVDPELAKIVTDEFRPQPQEYREPQAASPEPTPAPASETTASESTPPPQTAEVVPVAVPVPQSQPKAGDYTPTA